MSCPVVSGGVLAVEPRRRNLSTISDEVELAAEIWQRAKAKLAAGQNISDGMYVSWTGFVAILKRSHLGSRIRLVAIDQPAYNGNWYWQVASWRSCSGEELWFKTLTKFSLAGADIFTRLPPAVRKGLR